VLALLEAGPAGHRVDQVVGDLGAVEDALEARGVGDIALDDLAAGVAETPGPLRVPNQGPDVPAGAEQ